VVSDLQGVEAGLVDLMGDVDDVTRQVGAGGPGHE